MIDLSKKNPDKLPYVWQNENGFPTWVAFDTMQYLVNLSDDDPLWNKIERGAKAPMTLLGLPVVFADDPTT